MRCASVSQIKGKARNKTGERPRQGSKLGQFYDQLMANRGLPVSVTRSKVAAQQIIQLRDFYGLDIRSVSKRGRGGWAAYVLAGEWFGRVYIDYIAERLNTDGAA
jgi:hypothetical protein